MSAAHFEDRFSDWVPLDFPGQPIFAGDQVTNRMAQLRQKIEEVRTQWNNRSRFIDSLQRRILSAGVTGCEREIMENNCRRLFSTTKDWADTDMGYTPSGFEDMDFSAITLYSSVLGYDKLFKAFNSHLRQGDILANEGLVRDVVFLVELMRIELYNYRFANWGNSKISNFEGTVYRGVPLKLEDVAHFRNASQGPLKTRVMSIPLSFMSSSTDPKRAEDFAAATAAQGLVPFQFIIHVRGIDRDLFSWYSEKYPESIVTSICAVPIARLSEVSKEKEVLLGGAFFQILQFSEEPYTVELVMLNSNRDHQTAHASNKGRDKTMRTDFTTIVLISRSEVCAALAEERNLPDMAREYRQWATELRAQLDLQESPKRELAAVTILGTEWPARTLAKPISAPQRHKRVRYSDAAASGNWNTVFNIINEEYEWQKHEWVNFSSPRSKDQSDLRCGWTALHHMAYGGAPPETIERLIALGAWRTLQTDVEKETPVELAMKAEHTNIVELLQPKPVHVVAPEVLDSLQTQFHRLIQKLAAQEVSKNKLRLPQLSVLTEIIHPRMWFTLPGTYSGFAYELVDNDMLSIQCVNFGSLKSSETIIIRHVVDNSPAFAA